MTYSLLLLPGDGIGPEVIEETRRVLGWYSAHRNLAFATASDLVGGIAYEAHGTPATDAMIQKAKAAKAAAKLHK